MATANTRKKIVGEKNELYTTPLESLEKFYEQAPELLKYSAFVLEPCFGAGDISRFLKEKGKMVYGMDIENYGDQFAQWNFYTKYGDFLDSNPLTFPSIDCVVMNPPFTMTSEFIDKALEITDNVFMFNRINVLESKKRTDKFISGAWNLRKVWVHSSRVMCPKGVNHEPTANAVCYCWFWIDKNYEGEPTITWI